MSGPLFDGEVAERLRRRYVLDRCDGRPVLAGHADCPDCAVRLQLAPLGGMDLEEDRVRCHLWVRCPACRRALEISEDFEWGE